MIPEYITKDTLKETLIDWSCDASYIEVETKWALEEIKNIPAADVIPARHGKWVKATGMMPPEYCGLHICSECGHYAGRKPPYGGREMLSDYCPHCGARMDGGQ